MVLSTPAPYAARWLPTVHLDMTKMLIVEALYQAILESVDIDFYITE
jgi:hypothetical protein